MPAIRLSDLSVTQTPDFGRWQALNGPLGLTALGVNAVLLDPDEDVDLAHEEGEGGQQELYVVVAGRAAVRVGDDETEAGPGTLVAAPDPTVTRGLRALEPGTRVVCIGALPGAEPSEPFGAWISPAGGA